jgi:hypothetical protein
MLIELFIASRVNKAADSLRRIQESNDEYYEYYNHCECCESDNRVNGFDRLLAWLDKKADKVRIEQQLQGKKRTGDGEEEILD